MDRKKIITASLFVVLILCITAIFLKEKSIKDIKDNQNVTICGAYDTENISFGKNTITADIADTDCKKSLGLSGRKTLTDGEGMIFPFNEVGSYGFWMKDMNFPLDIIWIDNNLVVTGIEKNLATSTYDMTNPSQSQIFGEKYSAQYVLEVPAGYSDRNNLKVGDKIIFSE